MIARRLALALAGLLLATASPAPAMPSGMPFQGILTNATGEPLAAGTAVTFTLRDAMGATLWSAIYAVAPVDGVVNLMLGANDGGGQAAIPAGLFASGAARELVVSVGGEELAAIPLGATAYAFHAATADVALATGGLGPNAVDTAAIQDGAVTSPKLADSAVTSASWRTGR